ncbi:hypothetical protein PRZ48_008206 [Zasmidium cellare]|uniref:BTB domain-containing protein n=1 Tax=Zasmidium cellare TaxID=395010 RepID=A0ABR0EFF5_ZASCE|nr:hypothetical protein PRZ48_008206 [Zasmidium cellare]
MAGAPFQSKDKFLQKLSENITDTQFADFTIVNCGQEYKVHKVIVGSHSSYFYRLFKSSFLEATQNRIVLEEDPKLAVKCMIEYFYKFDYKVGLGDVSQHEALSYLWASGDIASEYIGKVLSSTAPGPLDATPSSTLEVHAHVYTLADKYDIPHLKVLAKEKFREETLYCISDKALVYGFLKVVPYVYENTAPGDMGLRSCLVDAWRAEADFVNYHLSDENLRDLFERFPELGADLFTGQVNGHRAPSKKHNKRAGRDTALIVQPCVPRPQGLPLL